MAPKTFKLKPGHCANPAAIEAWKGYDWAKALDDDAMFATKENAAMMFKYIKQHQGDGPSCLYLSLLAFARAPSEFFARKWGEVPLTQVESVVGEYVRMTRIAITLYTLSHDGRLQGQVSFGGSKCIGGGAVVIIPGGNGIVHALPLARPTQRSISIPPTVLQDIIGGPDPVEEAPACAALDEPSTTPTVEVVEVPQPVVAHQVAVRDSSPGPYVGPGSPPQWFTGDWVAGFLPKERTRSPGFREWLYTHVLRPSLAAATVENFRRYGTCVYYCDLDIGNMVRTGRRSATDGQTVVEYFTEGDCLVSGDFRWSALRVKWYGHQVLQVLPADITTRVFGTSSGATVQTTVGVLDRREVFKARCTAMRLTRDDPIEASITTRWMSDWAAKEYDVKGDPDDVAQVAHIIASQYRSVGSVGGGYGWGKCYSCGGQLTGKSRICCRGVNSPLARMIAAGEKVTSLVNRILYPGVVWCRSQHPPLKAGVETVATSQNFR